MVLDEQMSRLVEQNRWNRTKTVESELVFRILSKVTIGLKNQCITSYTIVRNLKHA